MDSRKLGMVLAVGGTVMILAALLWFGSSFAEAIDMAGQFGGDDYAARLLACIYSSAPICQGAGMFDDGLTYSPMPFWIGVVALLAGVALLAVSGRGQAVAGAANTGAGESAELLGFIPPSQYARYCYILALSGSVAGLLVSPLAIVAFAGLALAVLGLAQFRERISGLDAHHLGLVSIVVVVAALLLLATRGSFFFLLVALAQIACVYVGFNSYRYGRCMETSLQGVKREFLLALKPEAGVALADTPVAPPASHDNARD